MEGPRRVHGGSKEGPWRVQGGSMEGPRRVHGESKGHHHFSAAAARSAACTSCAAALASKAASNQAIRHCLGFGIGGLCQLCQVSRSIFREKAGFSACIGRSIEPKKGCGRLRPMTNQNRPNQNSRWQRRISTRRPEEAKEAAGLGTVQSPDGSGVGCRSPRGSFPLEAGTVPQNRSQDRTSWDDFRWSSTSGRMSTICSNWSLQLGYQQLLAHPPCEKM